jgi:hypothetical protein
LEGNHRQPEIESSEVEPSGAHEPRRASQRRPLRFTRKHALLVAALGVGGYFLRTDSIAREAAPVEVAEPPSPPPSPPATRSPREGLWIAPDELKRLPMSGSAWDAMLAVAEGDLGEADVADQDSTHDTNTLACALVAARTGSAALRGKAIDAIRSAIGTEEGARWLAIGRNLGAYAIAADVLDVRSGPVHEWLAGFLTRTLSANNSEEQVVADNWSSGSNASAQMGFVTAALSVYTNDSDRLESSWDGYRRYCGDRTSPVVETSNSDVWQLVPSDPVGIQDKGAVKEGCRLDGAIGNDMSRGGDDVCSPAWTQYPWVGLEGAVPAALVFARAGYPAWELAYAAIRRALNYLWFLRQTTGNVDWFDGTRSNECVYLVNRAYGTDFPCARPVAGGRTVGYTDWTHAPRGAALRGAGHRGSDRA